MKIGIAGPISRESIARYLDGGTENLPKGYSGAPLLGTLIGSMLARGHSVTAYTTSSDLTSDNVVTAIGRQFKITFCPQRSTAFRYKAGRWGRAVDLFNQERTALARAMQADSPDLVHAHWSYEFALAAIESGLPNLITCHDAPQIVLRYTPDLYRLSRYLMARKVFFQAPNLTAVSPYLRNMLTGYTRRPIAVVPNPLPSKSDFAIADTIDLRRIHPRISMVLNGWGRRKNPTTALLAFRLFRQNYPDAELHIFGNDFGPNGIGEKWAKQNSLDHGVVFLGPQPYEIVLKALAKSDLLLHPALEETFGMSIAEAMSLGIPVVGGEKSGAVPWVIQNGGLAVDVKCPQSISSALNRIFSNPELHKELAFNARTIASTRFSADVVAEMYQSEYERVMLRAENYAT